MENNISNDLRKFVRDYLNGENSEDELLGMFDLKKCNVCNNYDLEEDIKESINGGNICETCRNDI